MTPTSTASKWFNDPVHGFIEVPEGLLLELIDHPYVQRLARIRQMGMATVVYPGAIHTRFHHALGAMHLMAGALETLRRKGVPLRPEEIEATLAAILLHDIGHGPFSHGLEKLLLPGVTHEAMSLGIMLALNRQLKGRLALAIEIFTGSYNRRFLHALVASQLDMDRMDYLLRDAFFTGVPDGVVGVERLVKTLNVVDDQLVVEHKGIYSVEKFLVARRLMYWQVYLHKTSVAAESMLIHAIQRARVLLGRGVALEVPENLRWALTLPARDEALAPEAIPQEWIERFVQLDDHDIVFALKCWAHAKDPILAELATRLLNRRLLKLRFRNTPVQPDDLQRLRETYKTGYRWDDEAVPYFVFAGKSTNRAYIKGADKPIYIRFKSGELLDLVAASDLANIEAYTEQVTKYYLCTPD